MSEVVVLSSVILKRLDSMKLAPLFHWPQAAQLAQAVSVQAISQ
jgi:hypothetical protein